MHVKIQTIKQNLDMELVAIATVYAGNRRKTHNQTKARRTYQNTKHKKAKEISAGESIGRHKNNSGLIRLIRVWFCVPLITFGLVGCTDNDNLLVPEEEAEIISEDSDLNKY